MLHKSNGELNLHYLGISNPSKKFTFPKNPALITIAVWNS